jgi:CdiA C-terminal tRNase domain
LKKGRLSWELIQLRYPEPDLEWISLSGEYKGKTFDLIGLESGVSDKIRDNMKAFIESLEEHIIKADAVILDYRNMTNKQIQIIESSLKQKGIVEGKFLIKIWSNLDFN